MISKRPLFFGFLLLCIGIWLFPAGNTKNSIPSEPTPTQITATIITDPVHEQAAYNRIKTTFAAKVGAASCGRPAYLGRHRGLPLHINVISFDDRDVSLEYGDHILIKGDLSRPHSLNNPGSFNYREYLARKGVHSVITVKKGDFIEVIKKGKTNLIRGIFRFKRRLVGFIDEHLANLEGNILKGVLLGDRSGIENDLKDKFVKTGTVHILAISGLNVGLVAYLLILILKILPIPRNFTYLAVSASLIFYAVLTGANIPVARATIMAVMLLAGMALGRNIDILNCLGLAGIIILLKNPFSLFDAGFQLSFITVVSIIIFAPKFASKGYFKKSIAVSLAAWLGIIPVIAYHFNIASPVCILANIPIVMLSFLITAAGMVFLSACLLLPFLAECFALACGFLTTLLIKAVIIFSKMPFGFFWTHKWNGIEIAGYYIVLFLFGLSLHKKEFRKTYLIAAILAFLNIFVWSGILLVTSYQLRVTVLDVGHGDAIVVEYPDRHCILIDTGKSIGDVDMGKDVVGPYLRYRRINTIDAIFITHYDDDHSGGLASVKKEFRVRNVFDNKSLKRFDKIAGFRDIDILVLNPPEKHFSGTYSDNDNSLVLKITYRGNSFLFCADIQAQAMEDILAYKTYLKSDFIKIAHHGAWVGPAEELFINAISPKVALISAAQKDVSSELLNTLYSINCKVYKTYSDGAITVIISKDGKVKITAYSG